MFLTFLLSELLSFYTQRLASLETSLFSSGVFRFYDEHRDMRLDIDNMSYEVSFACYFLLVPLMCYEPFLA